MLLIERVINFTKATLNVQDYDLSEAFFLETHFGDDCQETAGPEDMT